LSLGHALDATRAASGVVHSVYRQAVNLSIGEDLWTLLGSEKADLPFGVRIDFREFDRLGLERGEPVRVSSNLVGINSRFVVDCRAASRWTPRSQAPIQAGLLERVVTAAKAVREHSWGRSAELAGATKSALRTPAGLGEALSRVVGCGPGATPSGDDVLVGIFAVLHSHLSGAAGARDAELLRRAVVPLLPSTTDVSGHLLRQAANGLFSRDLHEWLGTLIAEDRPGQMGEALQRVLESGATSGADACEGALAFAPSYFAQYNERIAA
jgi:hypothetical protein